MSDAPRSSRSWMVGTAVILVALVGGLISVIALDDPTSVSAPTDDPLPPRPSVTPSPPRPSAGRASAQRVSLAPPPERARPEMPDNPRQLTLTPEMRREMNYFVDDIVKDARDKCILPWLGGLADPQAEIVFDAVLYEGQLYDVGIRSLDLDMPERVRSCIGDQAWSQEVPSLDLPGEVRLQRSATFLNRQ